MQGFHRTFAHTPILMSLLALGLVVYEATTGLPTGLLGEGWESQTFRLLIFTQPVLVVGFLGTANWKKPLGALGMLTLQALAAGIALGTLWYLADKTLK